jgi:hypothetical protein
VQQFLNSFLGLGLLKQVKPISTPWLAIIDHPIDIGTKKDKILDVFAVQGRP